MGSGMVSAVYCISCQLATIPKSSYELYLRKFGVMTTISGLVFFRMLSLASVAVLKKNRALGINHKSKDIIPKSLDKAMDKANPTPKNAAPGISIRNGPLVEMDIDEPSANRLEINSHVNSKRKARNSTGNRKSYKEVSEDDDDDKPLVGQRPSVLILLNLKLLTRYRASVVVSPLMLRWLLVRILMMYRY